MSHGCAKHPSRRATTCKACLSLPLTRRAIWEIRTGKRAPSCPTLAGKFMERVVPQPNGCWGWSGTIATSTGYSCLSLTKYERVYAHRFSYESFTGPIPDGHQIDHLCRNRWCVNPAHLEAVTQAENIRRSYSPSSLFGRGRCWRGHDTTDPQNVYVSRKGHRMCRVCIRYRAERRNAA